MHMSDNIADLSAALAKAQSTIGGAIKGKSNPAFKSKYADLSSVWDAWQAVGPDNDLAVLQMPGAYVDGKATLTTVLTHKSGQWMSETLAIPVTKQDAQGYGSALTYARRYALAAFVGIAPEDDDGNAAVQRSPVRAANGPREEMAYAPADDLPGWPEGPHSSKSKLMADWRKLVHALNGASDTQTVEGLINDAKPMLMQFRAAAKANYADMAVAYNGGGDFKGVADTLAEARNSAKLAEMDPGPAVADSEGIYLPEPQPRRQSIIAAG